MRVAPEIHLTKAERQQLNELVRKGISPARVQTRARVLLLAAERGKPRSGQYQRKVNANEAIAAALQISARTVSRIRQRFVSGGLTEALRERARSGRPVEFDGETEARLVMLACSAPPDGRDRWTLQLLADRMVALDYVPHLSDTWVMQRLKKTNCVLGRSKAGASRG